MQSKPASMGNYIQPRYAVVRHATRDMFGDECGPETLAKLIKSAEDRFGGKVISSRVVAVGVLPNGFHYAQVELAIADSTKDPDH